MNNKSAFAMICRSLPRGKKYLSIFDMSFLQTGRKCNKYHFSTVSTILELKIV